MSTQTKCRKKQGLAVISRKNASYRSRLDSCLTFVVHASLCRHVLGTAVRDGVSSRYGFRCFTGDDFGRYGLIILCVFVFGRIRSAR